MFGANDTILTFLSFYVVMCYDSLSSAKFGHIMSVGFSEKMLKDMIDRRKLLVVRMFEKLCRSISFR